MLENVRLSFQGIWSHKMRSFLTMLGIIIGIAAIISIVSTIKGTNEEIKNSLVGAGSNAVNVQLVYSRGIQLTHFFILGYPVRHYAEVTGGDTSRRFWIWTTVRKCDQLHRSVSIVTWFCVLSGHGAGEREHPRDRYQLFCHS